MILPPDRLTPRSASRIAAVVWLGAALSTCCPWDFAGATSLVPVEGEQAPPAALPALSLPTVYSLGMHQRPATPHPAVARIVVPEGDATSYGSGTLVDVRDQFGLVVTNWHVVRDGKGDVEVLFPDGFRSKARPLKVDADWDLAALVIWRPQVPPVTIAAAAPQSGDQLTICGYGQGEYRALTGRCTQYYAPRVDFPQHMVELDVEARQGDSGGPIFNDRGELAGVLFGAGRGTTLGSFGGQVGSFLATLAPDIGRAADNALVENNADPTARVGDRGAALQVVEATSGISDRGRLPVVGRKSEGQVSAELREFQQFGDQNPSASWIDAKSSDEAGGAGWQTVSTSSPLASSSAVAGVRANNYFDHAKSALAVIGASALLLRFLRVIL